MPKFFVVRRTPVFNHSIDLQIDRIESEVVDTFDTVEDAYAYAAALNRAELEAADGTFDEHTPDFRAVNEKHEFVFPEEKTPPPITDDDIPF